MDTELKDLAVISVVDTIVPMYRKDDDLVVDARELYNYLEVGRDFSTWIKDRIDKYGFIDRIDFSPVLGKTPSTNGRPRIDYLLTSDCAKEIAMVENNDKGHLIRQKFISAEKELRKIKTKESSDRISSLQEVIKLQEGIVKAYNAVMGETPNKKNCKTMGEYARFLDVQGLGRNTLFKLLRSDGLLLGDNLPKQFYLSQGWFKTYKVHTPVGTVLQTRVTPKGTIMVYKKLVDDGLIADDNSLTDKGYFDATYIFNDHVPEETPDDHE